MRHSVSRRVVLVGRDVADGHRSGRPLLWAYGYPEIAAFLGVTEAMARRLCTSRKVRGDNPRRRYPARVDPSSLESLYAYRRARDAKAQP